MVSFQFPLFAVVYTLAVATFAGAQNMPTVVCAQGVPRDAPPIKREDCREALNLFPSESNVIVWTPGSNFRNCGSCKIYITKPSRPNSHIPAAVKGDAVTAFQQALSQCGGKPANATIGGYVPISVLLVYGDAGDQCS